MGFGYNNGNDCGHGYGGPVAGAGYGYGGPVGGAGYGYGGLVGGAGCGAGNGFSLIVVLFILLIIVGAAWF